MVVALTNSDTTEGTASPASVTFTTANWNVPQTVTVTGVDDLVADGNQTYVVAIGPATSPDAGYNAKFPAALTFTNPDNDFAGITVSPPSGTSTSEAGTSVTFTVVLTSQPTADVTVPISSSDTTEGTVSPASLLVFVEPSGVVHAYETSADAVDLGYDLLGRSDATLATAATPVALNISSLDPWIPNDEIQLTSSDGDVWTAPTSARDIGSGQLTGTITEDWASSSAGRALALLVPTEILWVHQLRTLRRRGRVHRVTLYRLYAASSASAASAVATWTVRSTSVSLPAGVLASGETYFAAIGAWACAPDNSDTAPQRTSNVWSQATALTATFSP